MLTIFRKLFVIMTPAEQKRFWILIVVTFVMTLFEAASIFSILPFLQLLADNSIVETNAAMAWVYQKFGFANVKEFQIWVGVTVFIVTILGLVMKVLTVWITMRFALMRSYSLSSRLLSGYLGQPYEWLLSRHSADLGNAILSEVDQVVNLALLPAMRLIPESFLVIILITTLCVMEPSIALGGAALIGGSYGLIFVMVRRRLSSIGRIRLTHNKARFHVVQEAAGGLRELKVMGLEAGFIKRFRTSAYKMAQVQTTAQAISTLPRYALEGVTFGGMIILILVLLQRGDGDIRALVPTLGLIAAIGLRLIPAVQQVYGRLTSLRNAEPTLNRIHDDMTTIGQRTSERKRKAADERSEPFALKDRLSIRDVHYAYPNTEGATLRGVSLDIEAKTTVGIVGGTGAGKTTLVDVILALLEPSEGQLLIDGQPLVSTSHRAWQSTLGYVPQTIFLGDGTVAENIAFGRTGDEVDMVAVEAAAKAAALHDFIQNELPLGYDTPVGERGTRLSGGQRQRVGIARALYTNPSTLIFDEATSALDTLTEAAVIEAVLNLSNQKTVIMIAHRLSTIRDCDQIILMENGQVAATGTFDELLEKSEQFRLMANGVS